MIVASGYTATDLNGHSGYESVTEGTDAIVAAASAEDVPARKFDRLDLQRLVAFASALPGDPLRSPTEHRVMSSAPSIRRKGMDSGYADINGLHLYYEIHGDAGTPVVLLHGGVMTIGLTYESLLPSLADHHRAIGVDFQAHGRTADIDRDLTYANLAGDVVALLDHLGIDRANVIGHSMGGGTALELAVNHPDRLLSVVTISASVRPEGAHPDLADPSTYATSTRMPTERDFADMAAAYAEVAPHPERFADLPARSMTSLNGWDGWTDAQLARIRTPTLIVVGDHDFTTAGHAALMQELIPASQLAILPGTTHLEAPRRADVLRPMLAAFLR